MQLFYVFEVHISRRAIPLAVISISSQIIMRNLKEKNIIHLPMVEEDVDVIKCFRVGRCSVSNVVECLFAGGHFSDCRPSLWVECTNQRAHVATLRN